MNQEFSDYCASKLGHDFNYKDALALRPRYEEQLKDKSEQFRVSMLEKADSYLVSISRMNEKKEKLDLDYTPQGAWEKYALKRIRDASWSSVGVVSFLAVFYTFMLLRFGENKEFIWIFWLFVALALIDRFEKRALKRILENLNERVNKAE